MTVPFWTKMVVTDTAPDVVSGAERSASGIWLHFHGFAAPSSDSVVVYDRNHVGHVVLAALEGSFCNFHAEVDLMLPLGQGRQQYPVSIGHGREARAT